MATEASRTTAFQSRKHVHLRAVPSTQPGPGAVGSPGRVPAGRPRAVGSPTAPAARKRRATTAAVDEAVVAALESLDVIEGYAQEVADAFRWNQIQDACGSFVDLIKSTRMVLELAGATAGASGATLQAAFEAGESRADEEMHDVINRLIECHMQEDWSELADTLDRDFVVALGLWRTVFLSLGTLGQPVPPSGHAA